MLLHSKIRFGRGLSWWFGLWWIRRLLRWIAFWRPGKRGGEDLLWKSRRAKYSRYAFVYTMWRLKHVISDAWQFDQPLRMGYNFLKTKIRKGVPGRGSSVIFVLRGSNQCLFKKYSNYPVSEITWLNHVVLMWPMRLATYINLVLESGNIRALSVHIVSCLTYRTYCTWMCSM